MGGVTTLDSGLIVNGVPVGGAGVGNSYYVCPTATTDYRTLMWERYEDTRYEIDNSLKLHTTIASAYAATTSGRNDTVYVAPSTYTHTAVLTWANSNTHLIGLHSGTPWSNNVIVQHTSGTAVSPVIDVTGSDNHFKGLHFIMGGSDAAQHIFLKVAGSGNHYENCWFEGPTDGTQGADTDVEVVTVDGGGNYFKNCIFGTTAHNTMTGAAQVGWTGHCYRSTFEDCMFYFSCPSANTGVFLDASSGSDLGGPQFFKNCMFVAWAGGSGAMVGAVRGAQLGNGMLVFDSQCIFVGFDKINATGGVGATNNIWSGHPLGGTHSGSDAGVIQRIVGSIP